MANLKGTKTAENLMKAFAGESQARARYMMYASVADKEGYKQIKNIFSETAENEVEHAKRFYNLLLAGFEGELPKGIEITAEFPVQKGDTLTNLLAAAAGENEEWVELYPQFAEVAKLEGFNDVYVAFMNIAKAETNHEKRFLKLAENIKADKVFKKDGKVYWKCGNCGYVHEADAAPEACPACIHPKAYFEVYVETF